MSNEKLIDGILPCSTTNDCPLVALCGGSTDFKAPNTKKLCCLLTHNELLGIELYKRDEPIHKCTIGDYVYEMLWVSHNEIKDTIDLLQKWNEPINDRKAFYICYELFSRIYNAYDLGFLRESYQQLRAIANALDKS